MPVKSKPNWAHQTIWMGDNLGIMRGMNSESVDLIYADPPFNSNRTYSAPIGSEAAGASFKDAWTLDDVDVYEHGELADRNPAAHSVITTARLAHGKGMQSYLIFMAVRLLEMHRVLKPTGSIYLHCDPTAGHYLKLLLDGIFGRTQFRNEITWKRVTTVKGNFGQNSRFFGRSTDTLLFYSKGDEYYFDQPFAPYSEEYIKKAYRNIEPGTGRRYQLVSMTGPGGQSKGNPHYEVMGVARYWRYSKDRMDELISKGLVVQAKPGAVPRRKYYLDEGRGVAVQSLWDDIPNLQGQSKESIGYPTQKPIALLERIIKASSNEGDVVFDPFCGCATSLVAADRLQREWAGIDLSPLAVKLVNQRITQDRGRLWGSAILRTDAPVRTDLGKLPNYRTHRHRLFGEQEGKCIGCETQFPFQVMEVDHILPKAKGGTDHAENLQLLCSGCNRRKGQRTMAEWRAAEAA